MSWKVKIEDLKEIKKDIASQNLSTVSNGSKFSKSTSAYSASPENQMSIKTAEYRGGIVVVKSLRKQRVKIDRDLKIEMRSVCLLMRFFP